MHNKRVLTRRVNEKQQYKRKLKIKYISTPIRYSAAHRMMLYFFKAKCRCGVRHLMFVQIIFSSVSVAEWPSFWKELLTRLTICSPFILTTCNFSYFPFWF